MIDLDALRCFAAGCLLVAGLWQLEMIEVHRSWGFALFVLPFGVEVEWWIARDLFYLFIIVAFVLVVPWKRLDRK